MSDRGERINIRTGTVNGPMAVGANARAQVIQTGESLRGRDQDQVAERLAALERAVEAHRDRLADPELVLETVATLAEALRAERPNRVTVKGLLTGVADHVRSVAVLVDATRALGEAVSRLW
jgi:hypothetical protein